jgi:hypothetical protein
MIYIIAIKYHVLSKFYYVIDVHLFKDANMKQLDIHDYHDFIFNEQVN